MKIVSLTLKNFRGYKEQTKISFDDLTVFVGKNDIGKSTILEALDIFFNDGKGTVKIDKDDLSRGANSEIFTIGVVFSDFPEKIVVDSSIETTLEQEYLLNGDGLLEIHKAYKKGKIDSTVVIANHPSNDEVVAGLLQQKIKELKEIVDSKSIDCPDKRVASILRKSIRDSYDSLILDVKPIPVDQEGLKTIWSQIEKYLPVYALFQSDRENKDQDSEVQDPMKIAIQEILKREDLQNKLNDVANEVKLIAKQIADSTLSKLNEMNPEIANELKAVMPPNDSIKWDSVFKGIAIAGDDDIPMNKRGSGVRRLVLLNFFRAEAERRRNERNVPNVIYAVEEPETSQHPTHQIKLVEALIELSSSENTQVILTTHSPSLAQLIPSKNLRFIEKNKASIVFNEGDVGKIAKTLGVLPNYNAPKFSYNFSANHL